MEGLSSRSPSIALWFGSGIHEALAHYYDLGTKRNNDFIDVWLEYCKSSDADGTFVNVDEMGEEWVEARDLGVQMLQGYLKEYEGDPEWDVIATEQDFQVMFTLEDGTKIQYNGTFDGVYREKSTGRIKLMEHKTCKALPAKDGEHLTLDDQAGSYWTVAATILRNKGVLKKTENIWGISYNYLRKGMPDERPRNPEGYYTNKPIKQHYVDALVGVDEWEEAELKKMKLDELDSIAAANHFVVYGEVSKNQPPALYWRKDVRRTRSERRSQIQRIKNEAAHMKAMREGKLPLYKNPTMDCGWDCAFFEMCTTHEQGGDVQEFKDGVFSVVDPYKAHRKSA